MLEALLRHKLKCGRAWCDCRTVTRWEHGAALRLAG